MEEVLKIFKEVKENVPQILGLALFDRDGFMIVSLMDIPEYDEEAAAAFHADLWYEMNKFISSMPEEIGGPLRSVVLELGIAYLQMFIIGDYGIMAATTKEIGMGALRRIVDEMAPRILKVLEE